MITAILLAFAILIIVIELIDFYFLLQERRRREEQIKQTYQRIEEDLKRYKNAKSP